MAKAKAAKTKSAKKAVPKKKLAAKPASKAVPKRAVEAKAPRGATSTAEGGDADVQAKELIELATEVLPSDQVRAMTAGLDVVALANAGSLSAAVTLEAWRAGTCLCDPSSQKAMKAQDKVLAQRGLRRHQAKAGCARRFLAARKVQDDETSSVAWLLVHSLLSDGAIDEAIEEFKKWTPAVMKLGKSGALDRDVEWVDTWYGTYLWKLEGVRADERARASKERDKAKRG